MGFYENMRKYCIELGNRVSTSATALFSSCTGQNLESKMNSLHDPGIGQLVETFSTHYYPNMQVKNKFEELYKIITGEEKPDNIKFAILPLEDYFKVYREIHKKDPDIENDEKKGYTGNIEFTLGNPESCTIVVLNNVEDFLSEAISHGIGRAKYAIEYYKSNPEGNISIETDKVVRETAAHIAVQRSLPRRNSKEYIKTRYFNEMFWFGDSKDRPGADYAAGLIQKYGVSTAWNKILSIRKEQQLKKLIK